MPANAVDPGLFVAPRLYVSDATIERLAVLIETQPRGQLLIADELAGLLNNLGRYSPATTTGSSPVPLRLAGRAAFPAIQGPTVNSGSKCWGGRPYVVERMGRPPVVIDHLMVAVLGGIQPSKLADVT